MKTKLPKIYCWHCRQIFLFENDYPLSLGTKAICSRCSGVVQVAKILGDSVESEIVAGKDASDFLKYEIRRLKREFKEMEKRLKGDPLEKGR